MLETVKPKDIEGDAIDQENFKLSPYKHLQKLSKLSPLHGMAFAASCSERLLPNYQAFSMMESWGNLPILRTGLDTAWRILEGHPLKKEQIIQTIEASKKIIPDNEQFTSLFTDAALNAVASMIYTLQCGVEEDIKFAIHSGQAAIQTIETYLINVNTPTLGIQLYDESLNEWIQQAPLLLAEINIQKKTVELLQSQSILEKSFLKKLKNSAKDVGIFPLQRGLVVREV